MERRVMDIRKREVRRAVYSGTFDPITLGHLDIIKRASKIFDEIIVAVAKNEEKRPMFELDKRVEFVKKAIDGLEGVKVLPFSGLLVEFTNEVNANTIIRGLRTTADFEYELQMDYANSSLKKELDTVYLMPSLNYSFISSSIVRAILKYGGDISHLVPDKILEDIRCI
jgi:pantetheine-phosphate adenylyltransferase